MTEPTTEELVQEIKRWPRHPHTPKSNQFLDQVSKRLSDLEGKLGEARKALAEANDELEIARIWMPRPPIMTTGRSTGPDTPPTSKPAEALKLTASGGGDNSLSQGASVAHPSVRPETQHSAGGEG